jgi:EAL domain-containing protein (putative c-di-GMP-specific phosphodiesterase class I)
VLDLGCSLDMPVTAEGIETQTQAQMLAELGCAYGQGYLFGRPAPAHATLALIRDMQHSALDERGLRAV